MNDWNKITEDITDCLSTCIGYVCVTWIIITLISGC